MLDNIKFDFAFSFAGEDREIVENIYKQLTTKGYKVFYDNAYQSQLVGTDLYSGLRDLYKNKGTYIVCFISEDYQKKVWTNLEFTAIKERLMSTFFASGFLIPIVIGNSQMLEDIPAFIGFYKHCTIDDTVKMLLQKIESAIQEHNLIDNVNNCITYICPQITERLLSHNINAKLFESRDIEVSKNDHSIVFVFSSDAISQTPCILVTKNSEELNCDGSFPSFIVTWKRGERLLFSIHEFDGNSANEFKNQPLNGTINYISSLIENEIVG